LITDKKSAEDLHEATSEIMAAYMFAKEKGLPVFEPVFVLGEHREVDVIETDLVVRNPAVPVESPLLALAFKNNVPVETDISLFFRLCPFEITAITGTRGKSTTTAWVGEMMKHAFGDAVIAGNNQRSPLNDLERLLESKKKIPVILELSSWMTESLAHVGQSAHVAAFTNIYPDHLDRYSSISEYRDAKAILFEKQTENDIAVLSYDHELVREVSPMTKARVTWTSLQELGSGYSGACVVDGNLIFMSEAGEKTFLVTVDDLSLKGVHNLANGLTASATAFASGVPIESIKYGLTNFAGLFGRQEQVAKVSGVDYVNDTTATTTEGVVAALNRFAAENKKIVLITGGTTKGLSYVDLGQRINETCRAVIFLSGSATEEMKEYVDQSLVFGETKSMSEAVELASLAAKTGDVVVMSPGASSFELFLNEFDRGNQFVEAVRGLDTSTRV